MDDKQGKSLMPDPNTVAPSVVPTVPSPTPITMPTPKEEFAPNSKKSDSNPTL